jgi:hypothetical protein
MDSSLLCSTDLSTFDVLSLTFISKAVKVPGPFSQSLLES